MIIFSCAPSAGVNVRSGVARYLFDFMAIASQNNKINIPDCFRLYKGYDSNSEIIESVNVMTSIKVTEDSFVNLKHKKIN